MHFEELSMVQPFYNHVMGTEYLLVYHSNESYSDSIVRGGVYTQTSEMMYRLADSLESSALVWRKDRLVMTTRMKRNGKDAAGEELSGYAYVKCLYPIMENSPYYTSEDLFEARLSGDYSKMQTKLRSAFMKWKRLN